MYIYIYTHIYIYIRILYIYIYIYCCACCLLLFPLASFAQVVDHQVPSILRPLAKRLTDAKEQVSSVCGGDEGTG